MDEKENFSKKDNFLFVLPLSDAKWANITIESHRDNLLCKMQYILQLQINKWMSRKEKKKEIDHTKHTNPCEYLVWSGNSG